MMRRRLSAFAAPLVLGSVLTACSGAAGQHTAASTPGRESGASPDASIAAIVQCYRAHGDPGFPGPVYDPGTGAGTSALPPPALQ
jgi:hypothetical protein